MKPEYFPPREDIILQNEAPTDLYILVTGSVVSKFSFPGSPFAPFFGVYIKEMVKLPVVHTKFELKLYTELFLAGAYSA